MKTEYSETPLPEKVDVVVIGAGIIGASTAYYLAKRGISVALCEKGRIAGEQSSRNWGFVRQQGRDPAEIPMVMESLRLWRGLNQELGEETGFHQGGNIYLAQDDAQVAQYENWLEHAKQHQLDTRILSPGEIDKVLPGTGLPWKAAMHTPSDGRAEPSLATAAIVRAAIRGGAHMLESCAVRGVETTGGHVSGVVTERGSIGCSSVVLAGGTWSSLFSGNLGLRLPQLGIRESVIRTNPQPAVTEGGVWTRDVAFRRRKDGGYSAAHGSIVDHQVTPDTFRFMRDFWGSYRAESGRLRVKFGRPFIEGLTTPRHWRLDAETVFERVRVLDPSADQTMTRIILANLKRAFPELGEARIEEAWAGHIDVTPDAIPVISPIAAVPGFYLSTGYSGHGFGIGPGAGLATAEMVAGGAMTFDLTPFQFSRFER
ncbi:MAG: FAD-binding oxidoreductase [Rhodospirillaceae bacterium]|nr:FAD-binding oxidoreductase [Rhodospirillaceae bacterium]